MARRAVSSPRRPQRRAVRAQRGAVPRGAVRGEPRRDAREPRPRLPHLGWPARERRDPRVLHEVVGVDAADELPREAAHEVTFREQVLHLGAGGSGHARIDTTAPLRVPGKLMA
jgi:hypothetical protein